MFIIKAKYFPLSALFLFLPVYGMDTMTEAYPYVAAGAGFEHVQRDAFGGFDDDLSKSDVSWKVLTGVKLNHILALELQYVDFGRASSGDKSVEASTVVAGVVADLPIEGYISPYGKLGVSFWNTDSYSQGAYEGDSGTDLVLGLGFRFAFTPVFSLRTEYEYFGMNDTKIDNFSVIAQYQFF
jgi:opacity protein-like surface antigen